MNVAVQREIKSMDALHFGEGGDFEVTSDFSSNGIMRCGSLSSGGVNIGVRIKCLPLGMEGCIEVSGGSSSSGNSTDNKRGTMKIEYESVNYNFEFEKIFAGTTTQAQLYDEVKPLIDTCIQGNDATMITYGQTGAGKSQTLMGNDIISSEGNLPLGGSGGGCFISHDAGIIPRFTHSLFHELERKITIDQQHDDDNNNGAASTLMHYEISIQMLELQGEQIHDLLSKSKAAYATDTTSIDSSLGSRHCVLDMDTSTRSRDSCDMDTSNGSRRLSGMDTSTGSRRLSGMDSSRGSSRRSSSGLKLAVRNTESEDPHVVGAKQWKVQSIEDAMSCFLHGYAQRTKLESSGANDPLCHVIATVIVTQTIKEHSACVEETNTQHERNNKIKVKQSRINFVEVAGSERHADVVRGTTRSKQVVAIKKSILTLGKVLSALKCRNTTASPNNNNKQGTAAPYIPFRDSKLTQLLRGSLSGKSNQIVMLLCLSNDTNDNEESLNSLRFGERIDSGRFLSMNDMQSLSRRHSWALKSGGSQHDSSKGSSSSRRKNMSPEFQSASSIDGSGDEPYRRASLRSIEEGPLAAPDAVISSSVRRKDRKSMKGNGTSSLLSSSRRRVAPNPQDIEISTESSHDSDDVSHLGSIDGSHITPEDDEDKHHSVYDKFQSLQDRYTETTKDVEQLVDNDKAESKIIVADELIQRKSIERERINEYDEYVAEEKKEEEIVAENNAIPRIEAKILERRGGVKQQATREEGKEEVNDKKREDDLKILQRKMEELNIKSQRIVDIEVKLPGKVGKRFVVVAILSRVNRTNRPNKNVCLTRT